MGNKRDYSDDGNRKCTFADSKLMCPVTHHEPMRPPDPCLDPYLAALTDEWQDFADLKASGLDFFHWFAELQERGLAQCRWSPSKMMCGKGYGTHYWFRLRPKRT